MTLRLLLSIVLLFVAFVFAAIIDQACERLIANTPHEIPVRIILLASSFLGLKYLDDRLAIQYPRLGGTTYAWVPLAVFGTATVLMVGVVAYIHYAVIKEPLPLFLGPYVNI